MHSHPGIKPVLYFVHCEATLEKKKKNDDIKDLHEFRLFLMGKPRVGEDRGRGESAA